MKIIPHVSSGGRLLGSSPYGTGSAKRLPVTLWAGDVGVVLDVSFDPGLYGIVLKVLMSRTGAVGWAPETYFEAA